MPASPKTCQRTVPDRARWSEASWDGRWARTTLRLRDLVLRSLLPRPRTSPGPTSRGETMTVTDRTGTHVHAGAQAQRRQRARRRQQDRAGRRPGQCATWPTSTRMRVATKHDQRALRRRHHRRARPAVDPDGGRDDRRGAAVLPAGGTPAVGLHRQGGAQPGHRCRSASPSPLGHARGADRRRHRRASSRTTPASSTSRSTSTATDASSTSGCARSTTATCCATRRRRQVVETPQYFLLRVACGLARVARRGASRFYRLMSSLAYLP